MFSNESVEAQVWECKIRELQAATFRVVKAESNIMEEVVSLIF